MENDKNGSTMNIELNKHTNNLRNLISDLKKYMDEEKAKKNSEIQQLQSSFDTTINSLKEQQEQRLSKIEQKLESTLLKFDEEILGPESRDLKVYESSVIADVAGYAHKLIGELETTSHAYLDYRDKVKDLEIEIERLKAKSKNKVDLLQREIDNYRDEKAKVLEEKNQLALEMKTREEENIKDHLKIRNQAERDIAKELAMEFSDLDKVLGRDDEVGKFLRKNDIKKHEVFSIDREVEIDEENVNEFNKYINIEFVIAGVYEVRKSYIYMGEEDNFIQKGEVFYIPNKESRIDEAIQSVQEIATNEHLQGNTEVAEIAQPSVDELLSSDTKETVNPLDREINSTEQLPTTMEESQKVLENDGLQGGFDEVPADTQEVLGSQQNTNESLEITSADISAKQRETFTSDIVLVRSDRVFGEDNIKKVKEDVDQLGHILNTTKSEQKEINTPKNNSINEQV